jgi:ABC-type branched-subunit amino acid transport system substrate-binding protein
MMDRLQLRWQRPAGLGPIVVGLMLIQALGCSSHSSPSTPGRHPNAPSGAPPESAVASPTGREEAGVAQGKAIYTTGISLSGRPIRTRLAGGNADVPAAVLKCGNCHGRDGIGTAEGGITPATITWDELTKEYSAAHPSGRQRPPYDERSLRRAITMGLDPAGRPLDASMPRYALDREDLDDLVVYLKELGQESEQGITDQTIVVGTILPPSRSLGEMNKSVRSVLSAYFEEVNSQGGIYGRRLELRWVDAPDSAEDRPGHARRFLERQDVFALVAPFIDGSDEEVTAAARKKRLPIVAPFTSSAKSSSPLNRYVFYLHAGLVHQAGALAVFASDRLAGRKPSSIVLFAETDERDRCEAEEVRAALLGMGSGPIKIFPVVRGAAPAESIDHLKNDIEALFVLSPGSPEVQRWISAAARSWRPLVLIPGSRAGEDVFKLAPGARDRVFLSFPTLPRDVAPAGRAEYERLAVAHGLPKAHLQSQLETLAAAKIFVDALTATGRSATREKLVDELEKFYQKPTGLTCPVTYGPNRRFGTCGAYIVGFDPRQAKLIQVSGYIEPPAARVSATPVSPALPSRPASAFPEIRPKSQE